MNSTVTLNASPAAQRTAPARRADISRPLAALLLAAAVAALAVVVDQLMQTWADDHLFVAWVAMWAVLFAGTLLLAGTARRLAGHVMLSLDGWAQRRAQARADARFLALARTDRRLMADLQMVRDRAEPVLTTLAAAAVTAPVAATVVAQAEPEAPQSAFWRWTEQLSRANANRVRLHYI